jgi:hypothetical protein
VVFVGSYFFNGNSTADNFYVLTEYIIMDDGGHLDFQDGKIGMTLKPSVTIHGPPPLLQLDNSTIESNLQEL